MNESNRRAHPRYCYGQEVQVKSDNGVFSVTGIDLALGGLRISGEKPLPSNEEVRIYLPLRRKDRRGSRFCALTGHVAWQRGPAAGIVFDDLDDDTWSQLASFLSTLPESPTEMGGRESVLEAPEPFDELRIDETRRS